MPSINIGRSCGPGLETQNTRRKSAGFPYLLALALACVAPLAHATDDGNKTETIEEEITVTSTLPELATETVMPADDLQAGGDSDLVESLRQIGGISAVRRGVINLDPVIRGLRETQIAATVDGARTFAAGPARMDSDLSHVGRHAIQSIRVVKGPFALAWGSGALSAIELSTHRPQLGSGWGGELGGSWGDNAERADAYANVWAGSERYRLYLGLGQRSGGDYEAGDGSLVPGDYDSTDTRWRLGWRLTDRLELDWSGGYQNQEDINYPGRILDATYFYARSHALELTWTGDGAVEKAYGQVYVNRKDHLMNNDAKPTARDMPGRVPPFGLRVDLPTESNTTGGRFRLDMRGDQGSWSAGSDFTRVKQQATRSIFRRSNDFLIFTDSIWPEVEIDTVGTWIQGIRRMGKAQWGATLRFDHVAADAGTPSEFFRSATTGDLDQDENNLSLAVSGTLELDPHWVLQAGLGRAVRSATALERYSDRFPTTKFQIAAEVMGNPELDPEAGLELDLGARYRGAETVFEAELFYRSIDDYITLTPDPSLPRRLPLSPPTVYRTINGDRAVFLRRGAEPGSAGGAALHVAW